MVNNQLQRIKYADSSLPDSEDEDKASHLQIYDINWGKSDFKFAQLDKEFEPRIASIFNQTASSNSRI